TSTTNAPTARSGQTAVWTGSQMIVWGGADFVGFFNTGGRYNPGTNSWTATSTSNATARTSHQAVWNWTGSEMIVWGGYVNDVHHFSNTGGRYCAQSGSPTPTPTPTPTATATASSTPTPTATAGRRVTPTPRPHATPHPRP